MRISVVPGDGIGPEVISVALERLPEEWEVDVLEVGAERYLRTGELLSEEDLARIGSSDALLFGAIGDPRVPDGILERGVLLRLRAELDAYINLRPFPELGITFVRENTQGLYAGVGSRDGDRAEEVSVNTAVSIKRCAEYAFALASERGERLTWVHKTNVLTYSGSLWREVVEDVAARYPQVAVDYQHVDAAAYHLVTDPGRFDVLLTENLFGDILSDLAAGLAGGLGRAASANLHPDPVSRPHRCVGLFEPVHGSAPDIAGTGRADPTAAIRAAEMLVRTLTEGSELRV
ncbi:MAG: isocitrate/isopropylmalate family dehydrogenase [Actinomycetota bacterium]